MKELTVTILPYDPEDKTPGPTGEVPDKRFDGTEAQGCVKCKSCDSFRAPNCRCNFCGRT